MKRLLFAAILSTPLWVSSAASADEIEFARDIFPILERSCLECHGPEEDKGDLRLDSRAHAFATDYVIVPGDPEGSELYYLVALPHDDPDIMPAEGELLPASEIALLGQWIEEGAQWEDVRPTVDFATEIEPILDRLSADERAALQRWIEAGAVMPEPDKERLRDYEITTAESSAIARLRANHVVVSRLAQNSNLVKVAFRAGSGALDGRLLQALSDIANLHDLDLSGADISDEELSHLESIPHLQRLNLSATGISDAGLSHLSGLAELRSLNLYGTNITDSGIEHLADLRKLESLYLWKTKVTAAGLSRLAELLPRLEANTGFDIMPDVKTASTEVKDDPDGEPDEQAGD